MQPKRVKRITEALQTYPDMSVSVREMTPSGYLYRHDGETRLPRSETPGTEIYIRTETEAGPQERKYGAVINPAREMDKIIAALGHLGYLRGVEVEGEPDPLAPQLQVVTDELGRIDGFSRLTDDQRRVTMVALTDFNPQS